MMMLGTIFPNLLEASVLLLLLVTPSHENHFGDSDIPVDGNELELPLIQVVILVRNKSPVLPYALNHFHAINYPKKRMILYIRADHCHDNSIDILEDWLHQVEHEYHNTDVVLDRRRKKILDEENPRLYGVKSMENIIRLKEDAWKRAKASEADYVLFLDADVVITYGGILYDLLNINETIVAAALKSTLGNHFLNYWPEYDRYSWYDDTFIDVFNNDLNAMDHFGHRNTKACLTVFLVHSCVLINLRSKYVDHLTFNNTNIKPTKKTGPVPRDDLVTFYLSAYEKEIEVNICNHEIYGVFLPPTEGQTDEEFSKETDELLINLTDLQHLQLPEYLQKFIKKRKHPDTMGFDHIYYINLDRRTNRRKSMEEKFDILGLRASRMEAKDGQNLSLSHMDGMEIKGESNYLNPFTGDSITKGEIGCFLSHYMVWKDALDKNYMKVMVFEDDVWFMHGFRESIRLLMAEVQKLNLNWDLIYLGRRPYLGHYENFIPGSETLKYADVSGWTLGYLLSYRGAKKLVQTKPIDKIIPVDLYFAAVADILPTKSGQSYEPRELRLISPDGYIVRPSHIENVDSAFFSDTQNDPFETDWEAIQSRSRADNIIPGLLD